MLGTQAGGHVAVSSSRAIDAGRGVTEAFRRRLDALSGSLPAEDIALIGSQAGALQTCRAGVDICREGDLSSRARVIVDGWAGRAQLLPNGRRQIVLLLLPGDAVCLHSRGSALTSCSITALTIVKTAHLGSVRDTRPDSGLQRALRLEELQHERLLLNHLLRLGCLAAPQRLAHLLLELRDRLKAVGLATDTRVPMPITQECLADHLGLSIVHVNRTMKQLRGMGLVDVEPGQVLLRDPEELIEFCDYEPVAVDAPNPALSQAHVDSPGGRATLSMRTL